MSSSTGTDLKTKQKKIKGLRHYFFFRSAPRHETPRRPEQRIINTDIDTNIGSISAEFLSQFKTEGAELMSGQSERLDSIQ